MKVAWSLKDAMAGTDFGRTVERVNAVMATTPDVLEEMAESLRRFAAAMEPEPEPPPEPPPSEDDASVDHEAVIESEDEDG